MITELLPNDPTSYEEAAYFLNQNEVVALPTETVYGLAGNAFSEIAVEKIFAAKERPAFDPLIVHVSDRYLRDPRKILASLVQDGILDVEVLAHAEVEHIQNALQKFWPGPLTLILPKGKKIPNAVSAGQSTVGIRCPAHPVFQAVLNQIDYPLAAPSANRFGRISPTEAIHVMHELSGRIPAVVDGGPCAVGVESTIVKIEFPFRAVLLRPGKIDSASLEEVFQQKLSAGLTAGELPGKDITPGSLDEHYAPRKPLYLMPHAFSEFEKTREFLAAHPLPKHFAFLKMHDLSRTDDLNEVARLLFKAMRKLDDDSSVTAIVADLPKDYQSGLGAAIADRLRRASRNKPSF